MKHKEANESFIDKFNEKFPNFKIVKFTNVTSEIIVEDGDGWLYRKSNGYNLLKSSFNIQSVIDKEKYIESKIKLLHPTLKLLEYNGMKEPLLVEDVNGFKYTPQCYDLLRGSKISIETCTEKYNLFVFKANKIHNNFYSYEPFDYTNGKVKIKINCPIHGEFDQLIESHLCGHGCKKCGSVGFSKESWLKKTKGKRAFFYILKVFNENEEFIKFGITSNTVKERYRRLKNYQFEIIKLIEDTPSKVYDMEKRLIKEYKNYKVMPKLPFEGWSECLSITCLEKINEI